MIEGQDVGWCTDVDYVTSRVILEKYVLHCAFP